MSAGLPVFVYGTLRPGVGRVAAARRLAQQARHLGRARCPGQLYRVHWYPGLVPAAPENPLAEDAMSQDWVVGDLFALPARSDLLRVLDAYEQYRSAQPKRSRFRREALLVEGPAGWLRAWVYAYHGPLVAATRIGSGDFLAP